MDIPLKNATFSFYLHTKLRKLSPNFVRVQGNSGKQTTFIPPNFVVVVVVVVVVIVVMLMLS